MKFDKHIHFKSFIMKKLFFHEKSCYLSKLIKKLKLPKTCNNISTLEFLFLFLGF